MARDGEPREILKYLLGQIYRTRNRSRQLDARLADLLAWMEAPIGGAKYTPTPRAGGISDGAAAAVCQMVDIEDRIAEQRREIGEAVSRVMDILACLPMDSMERDICEMRHIDLRTWEEIAIAIPMSRRHVIRIYDGALDLLLERPEVAQTIEAARAEYTLWTAMRKRTRRRWAQKTETGV